MGLSSRPRAEIRKSWGADAPVKSDVTSTGKPLLIHTVEVVPPAPKGEGEAKEATGAP